MQYTNSFPWCDIKIAFGVDDEDMLWSADDDGTLKLPEGWELIETCSAGARSVAIFRLTKLPTIEDGNTVMAALVSVGASSQPVV